MEHKDYLEHLSGIKGLMEERVKFKALSGLSGVFAGLIALAGAFAAYRIIYTSPYIIYTDIRSNLFSSEALKLYTLAGITLVMAIITAWWFSARHARKNQTKLWNKAAIKAVYNFSIPMAMGGVFVISLLYRGNYMLLGPSCLIFYGLALINAANYTVSDIKKLGIALLVTASISLFYPGYGLYFWAFGFGILHIVYGSIMYFKYEK